MSQHSNYAESGHYEMFIQNARRCTREEYGAHNKNMELLMDYEQDRNFFGLFTQKKLDSLLPNAKKHISGALTFAIKRSEISKDDKAALKQLLEKVQPAFHSEELTAICKAGNDVIRKYLQSS